MMAPRDESVWLVLGVGGGNILGVFSSQVLAEEYIDRDKLTAVVVREYFVDEEVL